MMKTIKMAVAAVVVALGLRAEAETVVPLVNAAFEDVQDGNPVGWKVSPKGMWRTVRGEGQNGSGALVWESVEPQKGRATCSQNVKIEAEKQYVVSAAVRAEGFGGGKGAKVTLEFINASGAVVGSLYPMGIRKDSDWCRIDGAAAAPKGTVRARITLAVLPGAKGKVVFDDVRLEFVAETVVPLVNAAFEAVQGGNPVGWKASPKGVWRMARGEGRDGSGALVWESVEPQKGRATCSQNVKIEAEKQYVVSAAVRAEGFGGGKGAKVTLEFIDASGAVVGSLYPMGIRKDSDWCRIDGAAAAPKGTVRARITLAVLPGAKGKVVFDDVRLERKK